jgi:ABC-type lipoprotein release transport system permease subunit
VHLREAGEGFFPGSPILPAEIERLRQIDRLPMVLAAFIAAVALLAVGYALVTAVRRRGHDLAILKTLGFQRRQVRATVAWHASTVAILGLGVGMPLGIVVGKVIWGLIADDLGVSPSAAVPLLALAAVVLAVLLVANVAAAVPARAAARIRPSVVLRSE